MQWWNDIDPVARMAMILTVVFVVCTLLIFFAVQVHAYRRLVASGAIPPPTETHTFMDLGRDLREHFAFKPAADASAKPPDAATKAAAVRGWSPPGGALPVQPPPPPPQTPVAAPHGDTITTTHVGALDLLEFDTLMRAGFDDAAYFHMTRQELEALVARKRGQGDGNAADHIIADISRVNSGGVPPGYVGSGAERLRERAIA